MNEKNFLYEFPDAKVIVVSGDIHGEFNQLVYKCCVQYRMTDTLIIVAGDCGFGFEQPGYYENVYNRNRERLSKSNNWIAFVRGNHDNPAYFNDYPIKHRRWAQEVWLLQDADEGIDFLADFIREVGLPTTFAEMGITLDDATIRAIADSTIVTPGCYKQLTSDEIVEILNECK